MNVSFKVNRKITQLWAMQQSNNIDQLVCLHFNQVIKHRLKKWQIQLKAWVMKPFRNTFTRVVSSFFANLNLASFALKIWVSCFCFLFFEASQSNIFVVFVWLLSLRVRMYIYNNKEHMYLVNSHMMSRTSKTRERLVLQVIILTKQFM